MNIVLVVFDSLRKDCVNAYGTAPWWPMQTPNFDAFAQEALIMTRAYPESFPTLPARRALYTGRRCYPFHNGRFRLKGDIVPAAGWGPIPEDQPTLAELLREAGYRTGLVADVYHMFKPSKNYWRGFDEWRFLRGQEGDPYRSGPRLSQQEVDYWLPRELQNDRSVSMIQQFVMNMHDRQREEDYFSPRVLREAAQWLVQNQDADRFFLTVESFDPHEPWFVPPHYRKMYLEEDGREMVHSLYGSTAQLDPALLQRVRANYCGSVSLCDRWFGHLMETMRVLGLLDDTLVVFTADHGHSLGEQDFMGKRPYPVGPELYDVPLLVRFPKAEQAGLRCDAFVNHNDITASILEAAKVDPPVEMAGRSFLGDAISGGRGSREHVTIGSACLPTVINERWWFTGKFNGSGILLHDLDAEDPFARSVAQEHPDVVRELFELAVEDAEGGFPEWLLKAAERQPNAPGSIEVP